MTTTSSRPASLDRPTGVRRELLRAGAGAALGAALRSLLAVSVVVLVLWAAEDRARGGIAAAGRTAVQVWLVAHGAHLQIGGGRWGLLPMGLALVPLLLCRRAGAVVAERLPAVALPAVVAAVAVPYAAMAVAVAAAAGGPAAVSLTALVGPALVAASGAALGAGMAGQPGARAAAAAGLALPRPVGAGPARAVLAAGTAAAAALFAAGAVVAAASLVQHGSTAVALARTANPGAVGGFGLLLAGIGLLPNAVVWAVSWLASPGFAIGAGTSVSPFGVHLGPVPGLPLLAAVPATAPPRPVALAVLLVPVLAGVVAGLVLRRRLAVRTGMDAVAGAVGCGAVAGLLHGALALLSGGPVGSARLAAVGPSAWRVALAVALEVGLGAMTLLAVALHRERRAASG